MPSCNLALLQPFLNIFIHLYTLGMAMHCPHIEDINANEFQHLEHLVPKKVFRHSSAFLWCKLEYALTYSSCWGKGPPAVKVRQSEYGDSAGKSQRSTTTKTLQTKKCGNFLKCLCIKNVMWLNSTANSAEMPLTLVLQSYCKATLYSSTWQDVK